LSILTLGIDEAGRGPVIGNMFIVGVAIPINKLIHLKLLGVKDSKSLSRSARDKLYHDIINNSVWYHVISYGPETIDRKNISDLYREAVITIIDLGIKALDEKLRRVVVDGCGKVEYLKRAIRKLGFKGELIISNKADTLYVEVSAASIIAKVLRDKHIDQLKAIYGNLGSGYPSDIKTRTWILGYYLKNGKLPKIVRKSWRTIRDLIPEEFKSKHLKERDLLKYLQ